VADLKVWNYNAVIESFMGFGAKQVKIETSTDGTTWTAWPMCPSSPGDWPARVRRQHYGQFRRGRGQIRQADHREELGRRPAGGPERGAVLGGSGPSLRAPAGQGRHGRRGPEQPDLAGGPPGGLAQGLLRHRSGRGRRGDGNRQDGDRPQPQPRQFEFGTTYYWKVDEVNAAATYPGEVWSFSTQEYAVVEDFESYTDKAGVEIFSAWIDGLANSLSGSIVGYATAVNGTFGETSIIHGGKQSMPFEYNNVKTPYYSEAERTFDTTQDWTGNGADTLSLFFMGRAAGFADKGGNAYTVSASGTDIWNNTTSSAMPISSSAATARSPRRSRACPAAIPGRRRAS